MPPSPSLRISPGREHRTESAHKRGRSFESSLPLKAKDDDLRLFAEMQNREMDNFLLHTSEDFEDSITKLRYLSDCKPVTTVPAQGESSDLLNVDGDKNDYDWLLTPPETPLFPSLDDEEPQRLSLAPRGRPQSQPISISRSSALQNTRTPRTSRGSASPRRLSPSPRPSSGVIQSRPSSALHVSPPPALRPSTPSRRPSTPPTKPSTPAPRSSTPTLRRMNSISSSQPFSSGKRGVSPVKASRGNSASPKLRGWQTNLPGFSSETPPNLRTSLSDRSASRSRGVSPASATGGDSYTKYRRQSMSPTPSRSVSSSRSHERDLFSLSGKASVTSSGDDDADSMLSVSIGYSSNPTARKSELAVNSRTMVLSKKPSRYPSASSAPKRSFDSAIRQMDQKRAPQNMFRPLLSSVPTTSFLSGKASSMHRPMFSRNSSLTTSSNASSEHGTSVAPYTEDSDHEQNDLASEWEKGREGSDIQEEIFVFDRVDELNEVTNHDYSAEKLKSAIETSEEDNSQRIDPQNLTKSAGGADQAVVKATTQSLYAAGGGSEVDCSGRMVTCVKCGEEFQIVEVDATTNVCLECAEKDGILAAEPGVTLLVTRDETIRSEISTVKDHLCDAIHLKTKAPDLLTKGSSEVMLDNQEFQSSSLTEVVMDKVEDLLKQNMDSHVENESLESHFDLETNCQSKVIASEPDDGDKLLDAGPNTHSSLKIDNPEATGISLLLQRSSSSKWPVVQGRAFASTNIFCSEPSYARDNTTAMKRSIGRDSSSASSSIDLGSSRQTGACIQRNLSNKRAEIDKLMTDHLSYQTTGSASELSINPSSASLHPEHEISEDFGCLVDNKEHEVPKTTLPINEELDCIKCLSVEQAFNDEDTSVCARSCMDLSASPKCRQPTADNLVTEDGNSCRIGNEDPHQDGIISNSFIELPSNIPESSLADEENHMINTEGADEVSDVTTHCPSVAVLEQHNDQISSEGQQNECEASDVLSNGDALHEDHNSETSDKDILASATENDIAELPHHANEEVNTIIEEPRREMQRSFTLEEATDIVLFCSSIVHDLAYKAANIAIEKELPPLEPPRPTVKIVGNTTSSQGDLRKLSNKRAINTRKIKQKKTEADSKSPSKEFGENLKSSATIAAADVPKTVDSMKPPKLESKCNCTIM